MSLSKGTGRGPYEGDVARSPAVRFPPELVDLADELGVEAETRAEAEPPAVDATEADSPHLALGDAPRGSDRVPRKPERTREDARPASRQEAERHIERDAVQHLVVRPVAAEHVDRVDIARRPSDLRGLAGSGREARLDATWQRRRDGGEPVLVHAGGERVDDEEAAHAGVA